MKTCYSLFVGLSLALLTQTSQAADVEEVESSGQAAIVNDDQAAARDKALDDALRKAIESSVGTMISSETITENYQLISDRIYSKADGYVKKYKILNEKAEENTYVVDVRAWVSTATLASDLDGLKTLMQRKGMPKMIIMVAEQNIGMEQPAYWWHNKGMVSDMRIVEDTLMEYMKEKGFTFVEPEAMSGKLTVKMPVAYLSDKQARRIAKLTEAQVIIAGKALAKDIGKTMEDMRWRTASAELSVRAINTDNGEVIAVVSEKAVVPNVDAKMAGSNALKKASQQAAEKLVDRIAQKWASETSGTNRIRMEVTGVKDRKMLSKFISVLQEQVRSVKEVHEQTLKQGTVILDVMLAGDCKAMATELEAKDFGGAFKLEIESVSANAIKIKLIP